MSLFRLSYLFCAVLVGGLVTACQTGEDPLFRRVSTDRSGLVFANTITENDTVNVLDYYYCYNGGGVAAGDFTNDGLTDLFFTGNQVSSRLYVNGGKLNFKDVTEQAGVRTTDWVMGASVVDINNDGWLDLYLCVAGPTRSQPFRNRLFINGGTDGQGVPVFTEQAAAYGLADTPYSVQAAFFDYDRDGDLDMYLMTNEVNTVDKNFVHPSTYAVTRGTTNDRLYQNVGVPDSLGHPYFVDVSARAGISREGYGLGLAIDDLNGDGWPDVYVANDFMTNDHLYINQHDGTFRDGSAASQRHQSYNGMGVDIADLNNDARPDVLVVDMLPATSQRRKTTIAGMNYEKFLMETNAGYVPQFMRNTLQLNQGSNGRDVQFSDVSQLAGLHATDWSWGPLLADFDNDGFRDAYITNGFAKNITDLDFANYQASELMFASQSAQNERKKDLMSRLKGVRIANYLYRNTGQLRFEDKTTDWGVDEPSYSNGAVYADLDNDGDLDIVVNNINEPAFLFENQASRIRPTAHSLSVVLKGSPLNRHGLGARLTVQYGRQTQTVYASPVRGYLSSMQTALHIGLDTVATVSTLTVDWPDGKRQVLHNLPVNRPLTLDYRHAQPPVTPQPAEAPLFVRASERYGIAYRHTENRHNDFAYFPLLLRQYSKGGPALAVADVDGRYGDDFFVGGAAGQAGTLFRQQPDGTFRADPVNQAEARCEDMGALFFDADNDGDADLYVASGGSEFPQQSPDYQDRLYLNQPSPIDTKPTFRLMPAALPAMRSSKSCVVGADYDRDGDIDLFVGGRYEPGRYPQAPGSYLLQNNKATFADVTSRVAPDLAHIGMVSSAVWTDFDADGWTDLIVVGEWMPITFFRNQHGKLVNVTAQTGLADSRGWWTSVQAADLDLDGDMDYVLGNAGTNTDYAPAPGHSLNLVSADYDRNGRTEPLVFQSLPIQNARNQRESVPFHGRDDLLKQWVSQRRTFTDYASYGHTTQSQLLPAQLPSDTHQLTAVSFETCVLENRGAGQFVRHTLPTETQFSTTYGILVNDYNHDGWPDLLLSGNDHASEVVYGWQDASVGLLLAGNGRMGFRAVDAQRAGLYLTGDARGLAELAGPRGNRLILSATNADSLVVLTPSEPSGSITVRAFPLDAFAIIRHSNGRRSRHEFQYGAGYLSQSSRVLTVPTSARSLLIVDSQGHSRAVSVPLSSHANAVVAP